MGWVGFISNILNQISPKVFSFPRYCVDTPEKQEVIENRTDLFNGFHSLLMESIEQSAEVTCSVEVKEEYPGVENDEMSESYQDGCESLRSVKTGDDPITE